jgi:DNA polymerase-3 subunit epsilon
VARGAAPVSDPIEELAAQVDASPDYRVLRRFVPPGRYHRGDGSPTATAVVVDVETTGLDPGSDQIIEFCGVPFEFEKDSGRVLGVGEAVAFLEDPGRPIPAEVQRLTGITDALVAGKSIDEAAVAELLSGVGLIIAHNAAFDRPFVERRLPGVREKHWACSQREVPWRRFGVSSGALEFLMMKQCGLFFDGHRADADCRAVIHLLQQPFEDGTLPMRLLLESARTPSCRIWALNSPFETKDLLKQRRYRWSSGEGKLPRAWYKEVAPDELEAEQAWLQREVYGGKQGWKVEPLDARRRYAENA